MDMVVKKDYNYIALLVTPWHVQSFEAAKLVIERETQKVIQGICLICAHSKTGYCVQDNNFTYKTGDNSNEFFYLEREEKYFSFFGKILYCFDIKKEKTPFYVFLPYEPSYIVQAQINYIYNYKRKIVAVIIDEGLAIYFRSKNRWGLEAKRNGATSVQLLKIYMRDHILIKILNRFLRLNSRLINCNLLMSDAEGNLVASQEMVGHYKQIIKKSVSRLNVKIAEVQNKYILINTQPLDLNGEQEIRLLEKVINVLKEYGYQVVLKPHPRENDIKKYNTLNISIDHNSRYSQEVILESTNNKPDYIIGYYSTSLITAKLFYDISALSIAPLALKEIDMPGEIRDDMVSFMKCFSKMVKGIESMNQLREILET